MARERGSRSHIPAGIRRCVGGRFAFAVDNYFANRVKEINDKNIPKKAGPTDTPSGPAAKVVVTRAFVVLEAMELGENPFQEEVDIRFQIHHSRPTPPSEPVEHFIDRPADEVPQTFDHVAERTRFYYTFTSEVTFEENRIDFELFVLQQTIPPHDPLPPVRHDTYPRSTGPRRGK